jgi:hypothetical protein
MRAGSPNRRARLPTSLGQNYVTTEVTSSPSRAHAVGTRRPTIEAETVWLTGSTNCPPSLRVGAAPAST